MNSALQFIIGPVGLLVAVAAIAAVIARVVVPYLPGTTRTTAEIPSITRRENAERSNVEAAIVILARFRLPLVIAMILTTGLRVFELS